MLLLANKILRLVKQVLPNGRAFLVPPQKKGAGEIIVDESGEWITDEDGDYLVTEDWVKGAGGQFEQFLKCFGGDGANRVGTTERAISDSNSLLDSILPDNPNFTDGTDDPENNDCNDWERRLGLIQWGVTSASTPTRLQRMAAIAQKMRYPGTSACRQTAAYLQSCLQAAGFPLYVYENLSALTPAEVLGTSIGDASLGNFDLGQLDLGASYSEDDISIIANYLDPAKDEGFLIADYHGTFFISGNPITAFASIPAIQQTQLRQLILNLKPAQLVGFLFIHYT